MLICNLFETKKQFPVVKILIFNQIDRKKEESIANVIYIL